MLPFVLKTICEKEKKKYFEIIDVNTEKKKQNLKEEIVIDLIC